MSDVDQVVRETLAGRAARVRPEAADPLPGVQRRAARISHRRTVAVAVPAVAGLAVAASVFAVAGRGGSGVSTTPADTESPTSTTSPSPSIASPSPSTATPDATMTLVPQTREEALAWGLAARPDVIQHTTGRSQSQGKLECGLRILGESPDRGEVYSWILCSDFYLDHGEIAGGGGASLAAVISVSGSGAATAITDVAFPRQASLVEDIRRLFPPELQDTVTMGNIRVSPDEEQLRAQAERDLTSEVVYMVPAPPEN